MGCRGHLLDLSLSGGQTGEKNAPRFAEQSQARDAQLFFLEVRGRDPCGGANSEVENVAGASKDFRETSEVCEVRTFWLAPHQSAASP